MLFYHLHLGLKIHIFPPAALLSGAVSLGVKQQDGEADCTSSSLA